MPSRPSLDQLDRYSAEPEAHIGAFGLGGYPDEYAFLILVLRDAGAGAERPAGAHRGYVPAKSATFLRK